MSLIKILLLLLFIYLIYSVVRIFLRFNRNFKDNIRNQQQAGKKERGNKKEEKVIELDKDQYKVE